MARELGLSKTPPPPGWGPLATFAAVCTSLARETSSPSSSSVTSTKSGPHSSAAAAAAAASRAGGTSASSHVRDSHLLGMSTVGGVSHDHTAIYPTCLAHVRHFPKPTEGTTIRSPGVPMPLLLWSVHEPQPYNPGDAVVGTVQVGGLGGSVFGQLGHWVQRRGAALSMGASQWGVGAAGVGGAASVVLRGGSGGGGGGGGGRCSLVFLHSHVGYIGTCMTRSTEMHGMAVVYQLRVVWTNAVHQQTLASSPRVASRTEPDLVHGTCPSQLVPSLLQ